MASAEYGRLDPDKPDYLSDEVTCGFCGIQAVTTADERALLVKKTIFVFVLTYALIPLVMLKSDLPKLVYATFLVLLHLFILVVYFYKVNFRALDPDWRSLIARIAALVLTSYILYVAAKRGKGERELLRTCVEMFIICVIHTVVLALLVVRVRYEGYERIGDKVPA
mmetsp:Transcript_4664/g.9329  ORF Transcript_4664/g.9329 Transcript_4664/m.9329 type:complete len:167 (-) Transcript_4664:210-710(-)